jgi:hypothetical protein
VRPLSLLAGLALLLVGAPTRAQDQSSGPYSQSVAKEGIGFRLGTSPLALHAGLAAEGGYDSNVFYSPDHEKDSALLRLRAHFDLATVPPDQMGTGAGSADPKVDFRLSTQLEYREYLTNRSYIQDQRSLNALVSAELVILPRGPFTLRINDTYVHTVDPRNIEIVGNYTQDFNRAGLSGSYTRGQLEVGLGDYFQLSFWETDVIKRGNYYSNEAQAFARLRFLPQTVGSLQLKVGYTTYPNTTSYNLDSIPIRALAGVSTLFSTWIGGALTIGYGNSLNATKPQFSNVIGNVEVRFFLPHRALITLSYDRDFNNTMFANYYYDDHLFVVFEQPLIKRLTAHVGGGVRFRHYHGLVPLPSVQYSSNVRDDLIYDARVELLAQAASWLMIGVNYNLMGDDSPFQYEPAVNGMVIAGVPATKVSFIKHSVFVRLDFAY